MTQSCPYLKISYDPHELCWVVKCKGTNETCPRKRGKAPEYPIGRSCWQMGKGKVEGVR